MSLTIDLGINVSADTTSVALYGRNLLRYSQDFSNALWSKTGSTVSADVAIAPDGTTTADEIVRTGAGSRVTQQINSIGSTVVTFSAFLKASSTDNGARLLIYNLTTAATVGINSIASLAAGGTTYPNSWRRYSLTVNSGITVGNNLLVYIYTDNAGGATIGSRLYAWGAQLELGANMSDYIATQ